MVSAAQFSFTLKVPLKIVGRLSTFPHLREKGRAKYKKISSAPTAVI
jgi:hypothetical protein